LNGVAILCVLFQGLRSHIDASCNVLALTVQLLDCPPSDPVAELSCSYGGSGTGFSRFINRLRSLDRRRAEIRSIRPVAPCHQPSALDADDCAASFISASARRISDFCVPEVGFAQRRMLAPTTSLRVWMRLQGICLERRAKGALQTLGVGTLPMCGSLTGSRFLWRKR
jgi:hypothetical protein